MNLELQLELQAYVDGELPARQTRRVEKLIAADPEARALVAELRATRSYLVGNEPEYSVPESREFYWSRIEREITRAEAAATGPTRQAAFHWRRWLAPLGGLAAALVLGLITLHSTDYAPLGSSLNHLAEVENASEHMGSFSFRSQAENMFVVWIYEKVEAVPTEPEPQVRPVLNDDMGVQ
ncbi:MAG TPA: hypothetical protein VNO52_09685 [Methylomirabilota bacterium]|nr:hypothetical protein [Methylomirabilota bacterium]